MKLTYIFHSGFALETDNIIIIMDYFMDSKGKTEGIVHDYFLKNSKKIYVFSSHVHADHFNPEVLTWKEIHPDIQYIFSADILNEGKANTDQAVFLNKFDTYKDENLTAKAYGSTDIGVSFMIETEGKTIFHAGDLNNWHWKDESTEKEIRASEIAFLKELSDIEKDYKHINLVMFPVDSRMGTDYMRGAQQFADRIKIDYFAPMHFGVSYEDAAAFKKYAVSKGIHYIDLRHRGQETDIQ